MTKKARIEKCRYILYSYEGKITFDNDIDFLYSIFECHSEWEQKKGCGVDYFFTGKSEFGNSCFYIMRLDGSTTDISFTSAITKPSRRSKVIKACRTAIEPIIAQFRKDNVVYNKTMCPITGNVLIPQNTHIDHYDLSFKELFDIFTTDTSIDDLYAFVCETKDNECKTYFTEQNIIDSFVKFHNNNTHLRAVTKKANLSLLKIQK